MEKLWFLALTLSTFSGGYAFRNELGLQTRQQDGCVWSNTDGNNGTNSNDSQRPSNLICNLRTLTDFWNYTFNREQIEQTRLVKITCSNKFLFESFLSTNQSLFQLRNLKEVQIESCKIRKMPGRIWVSLGFLKTLSLRSQNSEWSNSVGLEIEAGGFDGIGQLETLDLSQNNIWSLPNNNVFCPMKSLLKLNLSRNRLTDVEELGSAVCALSVQNLDLSFNTLRRLGDNAFSQMPRVSELRLQNNLLEELDDSAFGVLTQLRFVNLSSNRFVALPPSIFRLNPSLREINLSNNSISAISPQVFSGLETLLSLDISHNTLTSQWVKDDMFNGLGRLVILKLSWNQLSYLDASIFRDLVNLQALHLDNNVIEKIHPEAFQSLTNLQVLDLSSNRLTNVESKVFSNLFQIKRLYLDHNKIRRIEDDSLMNCTGLQDLGLADNLLQDVPITIRNSGLSHLVTLDIGENRISSLSNESFLGMNQLYGLRLVDNRLMELPQGFCDPLKSLRVLNVAQNRIQKVSSTSFTSCPDLRVLRLDMNAIEELTPLANQLPNLLWLNVSLNKLTWADYNLLPSTVEWFDVSHNQLQTLGGLLTSDVKNSKLRVLDASFNNLKRLEYIPPTLETLRLNFNLFETILQDTFIRSTRLRKVELTGNKLTAFPPLRLPPVPPGQKLPEFLIGNNPFKCSVENEWLTRANQLTVLRTYPRILDIDQITCTPPLSKRSVVSVTNASPQEFISPYKSECGRNCNCCGFACDCESVCPSRCNCFHDASWGVNIIECSNANYSALPERIPMDASEIYLDGNNISKLGSHTFIGKKNLRTLYLNDSKVEFISNKTFNGLRSLEILHLEDNLLTSLSGYEFTDVESLRELYLQNNLIQTIAKDAFISLKFLKVLRLDGNLLVDFHIWELSGNIYLNRVTLSGNPWSCECGFLVPFRAWISSKTSVVVDFSSTNCEAVNKTHVLMSEIDNYSGHVIPIPTDNYDTDASIQGKSSSKLYPIQIQYPISSMCNHNKELDFNFNADPESEILNNHISAMGGAEKVTVPHPSDHEIQFSPVDSAQATNTFWTLLLTLTALIVLALVLVGIFRKEIYYWAYARVFTRGFPLLSSVCCCCTGALRRKQYDGDNSDKLFDAYFIYSKTDENLVSEKISQELESSPDGYRLCLHYRDLCLNQNPWNADMILGACDASKRVVLVLSRTFLQSELSHEHFRQAIQSAIHQHQKKLVLILLPPFTEQNLATIYPELKNSNVVKSSSLEFSDKQFWAKLKLILPTPSNNQNCHTGGRGSSLLIAGSPLIDLHNGSNVTASTGTMSSYTINRLDYPYSSQHQYHRNILPYQIPISNCNTLTAPVPKHHIALTTPFYHSNQAQNHYNGSQHSSQHYFSTLGHNFMMPQQQQHHANLAGGAIVYPMSTVPASGHKPFSFNESFRRHLQNQHHHPVQPSHQPSNNNGAAYQPLDPNYSSSAMSSAEELEHLYSTLDSPLQSPNSVNTTLTNANSSNCSGSPKESANNSATSGRGNGSNSNNSQRNNCRNNGNINNEFPSQNQSFRCTNSNSNNLLPGKNSNQNEAPQPGNNGQMYFV